MSNGEAICDSVLSNPISKVFSLPPPLGSAIEDFLVSKTGCPQAGFPLSDIYRSAVYPAAFPTRYSFMA
jgi:hypothetical protein